MGKTSHQRLTPNKLTDQSSKNTLASTLGLCFLLFGFGIIFFFSHNKLLTTNDSWVPTEENEQKPLLLSPQAYQLIATGFTPVIVDWLWLKALTETAIHHVPSGFHPPLYYYIKTLIALDPLFYEAYDVGGLLLSIVRNDNIGAQEVLNKGNLFRKTELPRYSFEFEKKFWNTSWVLPMNLGYVLLFELGKLPEGIEAFREAAQHPDALPFVKSLAQTLSTEGGRYVVGLRIIEILLSQKRNQEPHIQKELKNKQVLIHNGFIVFQINEKWKDFLTKKTFDTKLNKNNKETQRLWKQFLTNFDNTPFVQTLYLDEKLKIQSTLPSKML